MALTKCPECNKEVSTEANSCPHCGKPGPFVNEAAAKSLPDDDGQANDQTTDTATKASGMNKLLIIVLVCGLGIGGWIYYSRTLPHPAVRNCEKIIQANLKSPSSYKMLRHFLTIDNNVAELLLEYEAANSFNASLKGYGVCQFGPFAFHDKDVPYLTMQDSLGTSPFESFGIVEASIDDKPIKRISMPYEYTKATGKTPFYTQEAPGYIVQWVNRSPHGYILSDTKPSKEELEAALEKITLIAKEIEEAKTRQESYEEESKVREKKAAEIRIITSQIKLAGEVMGQAHEFGQDITPKKEILFNQFPDENNDLYIKLYEASFKVGVERAKEAKKIQGNSKETIKKSVIELYQNLNTNLGLK